MKQVSEDLYGSSEVDLENRLHELLDDPRVHYRDAKYWIDEDGVYVATVLYEFYDVEETK